MMFGLAKNCFLDRMAMNEKNIPLAHFRRTLVSLQGLLGAGKRKKTESKNKQGKKRQKRKYEGRKEGWKGRRKRRKKE